MHGDGSRLGPDPGLGDLDLSGGRSVLVGDRLGARDVGCGGGVAVDCILFHRIGYLRAVGLVLGKIGEAVLPVACGVKRHTLAGIGAIGQKMHGHRGGTLAVLVITVVPLLLDRDAHLLGVGVGDREAASCVAGGLGVVVRDRVLLDRVGDLVGVGLVVLEQVREGARPVVGLVQGERLAGIDPVGQKMHRHRCRLGTDPCLGDLHLGDLLRYTVLGDEDMAFGIVGLHLELTGGEGVAVLVGEGEVVLIITGGSLGLHEAVLAGGKLGELHLPCLRGRTTAEVRPRATVLLLEGDLGILECLALGADLDELCLEGGQFHVADEAVDRGLACCGLSLAVVSHGRIVAHGRVLEGHRIVHRDIEQP